MEERIQAEIEIRMKELGVARATANLTSAEGSGRFSETPGGVAILKRAIEPVSKAIAEFMAAATSGKAGRRFTAAKLVEGIDPDLLAYLTLKDGLWAAANHMSLHIAATTIATSIHQEIVWSAFKKEKPFLLTSVMRRGQERGMSGQRMGRAVLKAGRSHGITVPEWSASDKLHLGTKLFELASGATKVFDTYRDQTRYKKDILIVTTGPGIGEWMDRRNTLSTMIRPVFLPTVIPPAPWIDLEGGGYFTENIHEIPLVKRCVPAHREALESASMGSVKAAVNIVQETPWAINKPVLEAMKVAWDSGRNFPGLPERHDREMPPQPEGYELLEKSDPIRKKWKQDARVVYTHNAKAIAGRLAMSSMLKVADEYADIPRMFFPHQLDWRGRMYSVPSGMSPQGPDESRSLLQFAEALPLTDRGRYWLSVHGANVFGKDKLPMDERAAWGASAIDRARATVADPFADLWWTEADKPWSFLAWCYDVTREDGMSALPVALDGSCNGLQHYSAMLRDPVGGAAVNLTPSDRPQDIYQEVANVAIETLRSISVDPDHPNYWMARSWLDFGIDRSTTKRAVMVLPYGGTHMSCMNYVREAVQKRIKEGEPNPFGAELMAATGFLSTVVWHSIGEVVVAAREAMTWLQSVARALAGEQLPIHWTTPDGFPVVQAYMDTKDRRVETKLFGKVLKYRVKDVLEKVDGRRQALALPPNFVHSLDATALRRTVIAAKEEGITSFAMIHDSYGTHASRTDDLARILRREFVAMYEESDPLTALWEWAKQHCPDVSPPPQRGTLDLSGVLASGYFFA